MPPESIIRSRHNPIYKQIRSLHRRDRRQQERAFLVEGPRFIGDALASGAIPTLVAVAESFDLSALPQSSGSLSSRSFDDELFATLADTVTSQGILAIFPFPELASSNTATPLIVIADGIQDPGNLGTLMRSAAGAGATQFVTLPGTVDPWSPKVVRSAAAAHFVLPVQTASRNQLGTLIPSGCALVAADAAGAICYDEFELTGPLGIAIGAEGSGLSEAVRALEPLELSIPLSSGIESLNAGVAGSVMLFEVARQRRRHANRTNT